LEEDGEDGEASAGAAVAKTPIGKTRLYRLILDYISGGIKTISITTMAYQMPSKEIKEVDIQLSRGQITIKDHTSSLSVGTAARAAAKGEDGVAGLHDADDVDDDAKAGVY